jgi:hypothetical protein
MRFGAAKVCTISEKSEPQNVSLGWPILSRTLRKGGNHNRSFRVPHPCAFFAQEPALSEAEGVGTTNDRTMGSPFTILAGGIIPASAARSKRQCPTQKSKLRFQARSRSLSRNLARAEKGVAHPFAHFAKGWEPQPIAPSGSPFTILAGESFLRLPLEIKGNAQRKNQSCDSKQGRAR